MVKKNSQTLVNAKRTASDMKNKDKDMRRCGERKMA